MVKNGRLFKVDLQGEDAVDAGDAGEAGNAGEASAPVTGGTVLSGHSYKRKDEDKIVGGDDLRAVGEADEEDGWVVDLGDD